jgi:hypothetical protein
MPEWRASLAGKSGDDGWDLLGTVYGEGTKKPRTMPGLLQS